MKTIKLIALGCVLLSLSTVFAASKSKKIYGREAEFEIESIFLKRQSKYALHRTFSQNEMRKKLNHLFSAFIWAPSSYNNQPGRLVYGLHGTKEWDKLYNLLVPFNKNWAKNAGALILVISSKNYEYNNKTCKTHSFDTGAAVENLLLEAAEQGLVGHPMEGFDYEKAQKQFKIPKTYAIECMIAIGEAASEENASREDAERDAEKAERKKIADFAFEGKFIC